jgi:hypothetical protein
MLALNVILGDHFYRDYFRMIVNLLVYWYWGAHRKLSHFTPTYIR